jgi:O-glycosyl hydrolase
MHKRTKSRLRIAGAAVVASSLLGAGLWAAPAPVEAAVGAYVDPNDVRVANWQGWGTSLAWWADRVGTWPASKRAEVADLLYSPTNGLGLNIVRYNFGGSADPNPIAAMRPGGAVPTFYQRDNGTSAYDWTVDKGQRALLEDAKARGADVFEAQLNSPPYWMTVSGDPRGHTNCRGVDNLAPANYDAYVDYIVTVLKKFRDDFGTEFSTISPYNEPDVCWRGGIQEGATLSAAAQSSIITKLDAKLAAEGMPTQISGPESSSLDRFNSIWNSLTPAARSAIDQINVHQYGGSNRAGVRSVAKSTGKRLWMSEWGCCDGTGGDSHTSTYPGLRIAQAITTDLDIMRPSAWVMWQAVEDEGIMQSYRITWGAIHADMAGSSNTYSTTKMFPFFRQFTNFVRPGSQIIGSGDPNVVASYTPSTGKLNLVAVNSDSTAVSKTFNLSGFSSSGSTASVVRTSGSESFAAVAAAPIAGKQLAVSLPAGSVTTYSLDVGSAVASPWNATTEYEIESVKSGQNLSIAGGSVSNGGQGIQSPDADSAEQRWRLQPDGGFFRIVNVKSGQLLSVAGESIADGGNVVQWPDGGGLHQRWRIVPAVDGGIAIVNARSGKLLTVSDGSVASGATVLQWGDTSVTSQRWLIAPK